jgi:large subunit ribosomal protein L24
MSKDIKRGTEVVVISGANKGKRGKILEVRPAVERVVIEGVNLRKKHIKKTEKEEGGIIEREAPIHISNVMAAKKFEERRNSKGVRS